MSPDFLRAIRTTRGGWSLGELLGWKPRYNPLGPGFSAASSASAPVGRNASNGRPSGDFVLSSMARWCIVVWASVCFIAVLLIVRSRATTQPPVSSSTVPLWEASKLRPQKAGTGFLSPRIEQCTIDNPCNFVLVADLDQKSRVPGEELLFQSYLFSGRVYANPQGKSYAVDFDESPQLLTSQLNEGGRGLELSELQMFDGRLLTFDDRTGAVFEITRDGKLVPQHIIVEGDGSSPKGMKIEWATEKDGKLWIGSFGKEYTDALGQTIKSEATFWIAILDSYGHVERKDWKPVYEMMREKTGTTFPGYLLHEAIAWSPHMKKWICLPRRVSQLPYDELADEKRGSNTMIIASKDFSNIQVKSVGNVIPERGFSSFKFLPGSKDELLLAVKTVEDSAAETQRSYLAIFSAITGEQLMEDVLIPHHVKYEGVEFIDANFLVSNKP